MAVLYFSLAFFVVIGYQQIDASAAGMQLSFALQITSLLNMLVRLSSLAENSFNAVERIKSTVKLSRSVLQLKQMIKNS